MPRGRIRVDSPGLLTTVQDLGRPGFAHYGVSSCGAADRLAFRTGNLLAGNDENAAALEMTLTGGTFTFDGAATCVITGGECGEAPAWTPFGMAAGGTLRLRNVRSGARMYLCVRGGIKVPHVLGSASTHLAAGIGGLGGRALRRGDVLEVGDEVAREPVWRGLSWRPVQDGVLRVTAGPQADWFEGRLDGTLYSVLPDSNRTGIRLYADPALPSRVNREMLTEGVSLGAVQVPPSGRPIILFVDHQTTGGYPKIASVISADLWKVGQLRPGDHIRFATVSLDGALAALRNAEARIQRICEPT